MSSLAVSLLLLLVVAIAVVLFYNLRQSAPPRWIEALQRAVRQRLPGSRDPASGTATRASQPSTRASQPSTPASQPPTRGSRAVGRGAQPAARAGERDEPRLAQSSWGGAVDAEAATAATPPSFDDEDGIDDRDGIADGDDGDNGDKGHKGSPPAVEATPPGHTGSADAPAGAPHATGASHPGRRVEASPASEPPPVARASTVSAPPTASPSQRLSEVCDCIVEFVFAPACSGDRLAPIAQRFRRAGSKPVALEAIARAELDDWQPPVPGRHYERLRAGILLANRHGPLNAMEFSEFVTGVQALAESLAASVSIPSMGPVLARARDLDATCAQLDAQIGVNVDASEAIDPAQLAALAPSLSIIERGSHRYVRPGAQGEALFSVSFSDSPNRVTFLLDVPRSPPGLDPWGQMLECANEFAKRLGARLADDAGRELSAPALAQIARQLEQRYESLDAIGLPAGSIFALKVFN